jgi:hypothetical protein
MILVPDHNSITLGRRFFIGLLRPYDAWFRGDRSYCLILYSNAL